MVGEDGRAVPLGGAPDHHVQKAIRRLDVMFLEGRGSAGLGSPDPWLSRGRGCGAYGAASMPHRGGTSCLWSPEMT